MVIGCSVAFFDDGQFQWQANPLVAECPALGIDENHYPKLADVSFMNRLSTLHIVVYTNICSVIMCPWGGEVCFAT